MGKDDPHRVQGQQAPTRLPVMVAVAGQDQPDMPRRAARRPGGAQRPDQQPHGRAAAGPAPSPGACRTAPACGWRHGGRRPRRSRRRQASPARSARPSPAGGSGPSTPCARSATPWSRARSTTPCGAQSRASGKAACQACRWVQCAVPGETRCRIGPSAVSAAARAGEKRVGECSQSPPSASRSTVIRTGTGRPSTRCGPLSTTQTRSATGFGVSSGGYVTSCGMAP